MRVPILTQSVKKETHVDDHIHRLQSHHTPQTWRKEGTAWRGSETLRDGQEGENVLDRKKKADRKAWWREKGRKGGLRRNISAC